MTINKTALSTSLLLALGLSMSALVQAETAPAADAPADAVALECVPQAEVDAMTDEDKGKVTLPVCEDAKAEGEKTEEPAAAPAAQ